jgi:hypothetical protein
MSPASDGGNYAFASDGGLYKLELGASKWTTLLAAGPAPAEGPVDYVAPDGSFFGGTPLGTPGTLGYKRKGGKTGPLVQFAAALEKPAIVDNAGDAYYLSNGSGSQLSSSTSGISWLANGQTVGKTFVDCHTKDLLQCGDNISIMRISEAKGLLYFASYSLGTNRVYQVPLAGARPNSWRHCPRTVATFTSRGHRSRMTARSTSLPP